MCLLRFWVSFMFRSWFSIMHLFNLNFLLVYPLRELALCHILVFLVVDKIIWVYVRCYVAWWEWWHDPIAHWYLLRHTRCLVHKWWRWNGFTLDFSGFNVAWKHLIGFSFFDFCVIHHFWISGWLPYVIAISCKRFSLATFAALGNECFGSIILTVLVFTLR